MQFFSSENIYNNVRQHWIYKQTDTICGHLTNTTFGVVFTNKGKHKNMLLAESIISLPWGIKLSANGNGLSPEKSIPQALSLKDQPSKDLQLFVQYLGN